MLWAVSTAGVEADCSDELAPGGYCREPATASGYGRMVVEKAT